MSSDPLAACKRIDVELDRQFGASGAVISEQIRKHLESCARCSKLHRWVTAQLPACELPPELGHRIRNQLIASLEPVTPAPGIKLSVARSLVVFLMFTGAVVFGMGAEGLRRMTWAQSLGSGSLVAVGAILFSLSLAKQIVPGSRRRIPAWAAMAWFGGAVLAGIAWLFPWHMAGAPITLSWECFLRELAIAAPAAVLVWFMLRPAIVLSPAALGGSVGAIAGLLGVAVMQAACVHQEALHLLLWHWSILAIAPAAGALIGRIGSQLTATCE